MRKDSSSSRKSLSPKWQEKQDDFRPVINPKARLERIITGEEIAPISNADYFLTASSSGVHDENNGGAFGYFIPPSSSSSAPSTPIRSCLPFFSSDGFAASDDRARLFDTYNAAANYSPSSNREEEHHCERHSPTSAANGSFDGNNSREEATELQDLYHSTLEAATTRLHRSNWSHEENFSSQFERQDNWPMSNQDRARNKKISKAGGRNGGEDSRSTNSYSSGIESDHSDANIPPPTFITAHHTHGSVNAPLSPMQDTDRSSTLTPHVSTPSNRAERRGLRRNVSFNSWVTDSRGLKTPRNDLKHTLSCSTDDNNDTRGKLSFSIGSHTTTAVESDLGGRSRSRTKSYGDIDDDESCSNDSLNSFRQAVSHLSRLNLTHTLGSVTNTSGRGKGERSKYNGTNKERTCSRRKTNPCRPLPSLPFTDSNDVAAKTDKPLPSPKPGRPSKPSRIIDKSRAIEPTDNDVLLGHVGFSKSQPGNVRFDKKALEFRSWYHSALSEKEKQEIIDILVESVFAEGHRFLKKSSAGLWYEAARNDARKEAVQALKGQLKQSSSANSEAGLMSPRSWISWAEKSSCQDKAMKKLAKAVVKAQSNSERLKVQLKNQSSEYECKIKELQDKIDSLASAATDERRTLNIDL